MEWSKEQKEAIYKSGSNIVVSAGAGSGKTAVLTERIKEILLKGVDIDSLLVITFTNAAAAEMKERIRKEVSENEKLKDVSSRIDTANISTFDAYFLNLVKKYHYILGVDSNIGIQNSYYMAIKLNEIIDNILDKYYKNNDPRLIEFYNIFKAKNDDKFKKILLDLYNNITLFPDSLGFLDNYLENYFSLENINNIKDKYVFNISKKLEPLYDDLKNIEKLLEDEKDVIRSNDIDVNIFDNDLYDYVSLFLDLIGSDNNKYDDIRNLLLSNIPGVSSRGKKNEELEDVRRPLRESRTKLKGKVDKLKKYVAFPSEDGIIKDILDNKPFTSLYVDILKDIFIEYDKFKYENNCFEFIDIQKLAIKLVSENEDIRNEIKNSLYEILIDEYQDTSDLQEYFINLIENNNVYMVGDIKQSIYMFRNANPYIFKNKYDKYSINDGGIKIDLNQNFRSRKEVLDNINTIFNKLMTDLYGDADYKKSHQMRFGLKSYNEEGLWENDFNMEILKYDLTDKDISFKSNEIEGFYIAQDIKRRIDNHELVYDKNTKKLRNIEYSDICILIDRTTNFELFKKILESNNIPLVINADRVLKNNDITLVISSLIRLVSKSYKNIFDAEYYHSLLSVGRSFLFQMDDELLFNIVMESKKNKYPISNIISDKAFMIVKKINDFSNVDIFDMIISEFDVLPKLSLIGDVKDRLVAIEFIRNFINDISSVGESLESISDYLCDLDNPLFEKSTITYNLDTKNLKGVKIMSIHKSKGLEFPICYFCLLASKFNESDLNKDVGFNKESGFYTKINDVSVINESTMLNMQIKDISEKIRLFYVALTRTREKMIILSPKLKNEEIDNPINFHSFNDFINYLGNDLDKYIKTIDVNDIGLNKDYLLNKKFICEYNQKPDFIDDSYFGDIISKSRISKEVIEVLSDEEQENIDLGLKLHEYMENIDFKNIDLSFIDDINREKISNIIYNNPLFKDIALAKTYHEHEFIMTIDDNNYHGIIDLIAEYDDHIDIIDYKLMNIDHKEYDRQLDIYKKYVSLNTDKSINCYLLSLYKNVYRKVS